MNDSRDDTSAGGGLNPNALSVANAARLLSKVGGERVTEEMIRADRAWSESGCRPDSPWLKVGRDALRDYQAALRVILKHADVPAWTRWG